MADPRAQSELDVLVIGAGAAGVAAVRSALAHGASRVAIVSGGIGATDMTAGWVAAGGGELSADALAWLSDVGLRPMGAYAFVSNSGALVGALSGLTSLLDLTELPDGPVGVVDLIAGPSWSAELMARSLSRPLEREVRVVSPGSSAPSAETPSEVARALDTSGMVDGVANELRAAVKGFSAVLFPPVLGLARDDVSERLARALGIAIGESGGGPLDPPAVRFARAIARGVPAGVQRITGRAEIVRDALGAERARVRVGTSEYTAGAVVLATGGLVGGGLVFSGVFSEPCGGAPVWLRPTGRISVMLPARSAERGMDPDPLFSPDSNGQTEAASAGVRLTRDGRVVGSDGHEPMARWLFGAGAVLTGGSATYGYPLAEALASGFAAGENAARYVAAL